MGKVGVCYKSQNLSDIAELSRLSLGPYAVKTRCFSPKSNERELKIRKKKSSPILHISCRTIVSHQNLGDGVTLIKLRAGGC